MDFIIISMKNINNNIEAVMNKDFDIKTQDIFSGKVVKILIAEKIIHIKIQILFINSAFII